LAREKPGQTLDATALVHEAYLRLVDTAAAPHWNSRGHFFAAAAEAMRRILVDNACRKHRAKHGGSFKPAQLNHSEGDVSHIRSSGTCRSRKTPRDVVATGRHFEPVTVMLPYALSLRHCHPKPNRPSRPTPNSASWP
jgi:hypothetical protein